jgi:ferredoxin
MILYFSGTGNSRHAAQIIRSVTGDELVSMNDLIKNGNAKPLTSEKPFVFVCPTYAWRIPRIVEKFIREHVFTGSKKAYFILTCGDIVGNAAGHIKGFCAEKGLALSGFAAVVMPENYVAMFPVPGKAQAREGIRKAIPEIQALAREIKEGRIIKGKKSGFVGVLQSGMVNSIFYSMFVTAKGFHSTDACTHCGQCVGLCPLNNVTLAEGKPQWGRVCTHCMACIGGCPEGAIEYKRKTQGKPRYYNRETSS